MNHKIMVLADLHGHNHPEFATVAVHEPTGLAINSRLNDLLISLRQAVLKAHEAGCRSMIVAGDVYHRRASVPTDVQQFMYEFFRWVVKDLGWEVFLLTGNHDQLDRAGKIHSLYNLQDICTVIDTPKEVKVAGANVAFIPYMESTQDTIDAMDAAGLGGGTDLLICHTGVEGAFVGSIEYRIKHPVTVANIHADRYRWVFLGHYHKPQKLARNVLYVGSPAQLNRAEAGDNKRFLVYDTQTHKVSSVATGAKEFRLVTDEEFINGGGGEHYCDVQATGAVSPDALAGAVSGKPVKLLRAKAAKVGDKRIELSETMTDEELLVAYLAHKEAPAKWLNSGLTILNKAATASCPYTSIRLSSMVVHNFMGISHAKLQLHRPGTVVGLLGAGDRPAYTSNGAGKSTLLPEAPYWCLFGKTARKLPADKVVNRFAKRDCYVRILAYLDKSKLVVTRFRKHKSLGGTGLHLELDGHDITEGTPELTEIKLKQLLGIDYTTFSSVVAFSPDNLKFVSSGDAAQKQVLDSILQTRRFSAALAEAKDVLSAQKQDKLNISNALETSNGLLKSARETQSDYVERDAAWKLAESTRVAHLLAKIDTACEEKAAQQELLDSTETAITEAVEATATAVEAATNVDDAHEAYVTARQHAATVQGNVTSANNEITAVKTRLDEALEQAGKPCPTCGVKVANTGKLIANLQSELRRANKRHADLQTDYVRAKEAVEQARTAHAAAVEQSAVVQDCKGKEARLARVKAQVISNIASKSSELLSLDLQKDAKPKNEYDELLPLAQAKVVGLEAQVALAEAQITKANKIIEVLEFWVAAFGNAGIRSFLLDQIMPDLTQYANEYSEVLTGGGTLIEFSSYNEDTMKDKFKIHAYNQEGSDIYDGNSSGEKRRVDICVMFALFRIAHSRTRINLVLLDEVLDTLDASGLEVVPSALAQIARDLNLTIYVTSHSSLKDMIQDTITVVKHKGLSTLQDDGAK